MNRENSFPFEHLVVILRAANLGQSTECMTSYLMNKSCGLALRGRSVLSVLRGFSPAVNVLRDFPPTVSVVRGPPHSLMARRSIRLFHSSVISTPSRSVLVSNGQEAEAICLDLLASGRAVALDCEGVALSRFGRCCLLQLYPEPLSEEIGPVYVFDMLLGKHVVEALRPLLQCTSVLKVTHDCREDLSALEHQFGINVKNVYDTQLAYCLLLEGGRELVEGEGKGTSTGRISKPYLIGLNELLRKAGSKPNAFSDRIRQKLNEEPNFWFYRPLDPEAVEYAASDVKSLHILRRVLDAESESAGLHTTRVSRLTELLYGGYVHMNTHIRNSRAIQKGFYLLAMLTSRKGEDSETLHFKLNLGSSVTALATRPDAILAFRDLQLGDIVPVEVQSWNAAGTGFFVERKTLTGFGGQRSVKAWDTSVGVLRRNHEPRDSVWQDEDSEDEPDTSARSAYSETQNSFKFSENRRDVKFRRKRGLM